MDSENHTVVIHKMQSAGLYSTAQYDLYYKQYIDGYIIKQVALFFKLWISGFYFSYLYPYGRSLLYDHSDKLYL